MRPLPVIMKIIFANKFYFLKGGAERYMFELASLLGQRGHEVVPFAMRDRRNLPTYWQRYFVSRVETEKVSFTWGGLKTAGRVIYSIEAKKKFVQLLDRVKPDLVHVHNIYHQISPSILPEAGKRGLPVVMTIHDYKLISPDYLLFHDGRICEATKPDRFWQAVGHRCVKRSFAASLLAATEMWLQRHLGLYAKNVDAYIAPSRFVQALLTEYGIDGRRVVFLPHFIDAGAWKPCYEGSYALFVGRLSSEKGVATLIRAAALAKEVPLRVVGSGPDEARLVALARKHGAANVVFAGHRVGDELAAEYAGARFVVAPSVWYEVFGLIALEAYAAGKPVLASQIGGLTELVKPGETGVLVSAGDAAGLAEAMSQMWQHPERCAEMGRAGRAWVEAEFTPEQHYQKLIKIYQDAAG